MKTSIVIHFQKKNIWSKVTGPILTEQPVRAEIYKSHNRERSFTLREMMVTNTRERASSRPLRSSSVTFERQGVVALPCSTDRRASLGVQVSSAAKSTVLLACRRQSSQLTVLVHRVHDPVDARVLADHCVLRVDQDDLEVLVCRVLVDPVRVQNPKASELASSTLLGDRPQITLELELRNTLVLGLSVHNTLGDWPLPASTADTDTVDNVTLLGLVTETAGLVGTARASDADNAGQLPKLPAAHTEQESQHIGLLLPPQLLDVLVRTHGGERSRLRCAGAWLWR